MRARRGAYLAFFVVAALGASALVYFAQPRNGLVRATVDIPVLTPITADMVQIVSVSPADAPSNAARSLSTPAAISLGSRAIGIHPSASSAILRA